MSGIEKIVTHQLPNYSIKSSKPSSPLSICFSEGIYFSTDYYVYQITSSVIGHFQNFPPRGWDYILGFSHTLQWRSPPQSKMEPPVRLVFLDILFTISQNSLIRVGHILIHWTVAVRWIPALHRHHHWSQTILTIIVCDAFFLLFRWRFLHLFFFRGCLTFFLEEGWSLSSLGASEHNIMSRWLESWEEPGAETVSSWAKRHRNYLSLSLEKTSNW